MLGADFLAVLSKHLADKNKTLSRKTLGKFVGCFADGYLGQCLVVYPEQKLVAVRQIRSSWRYNQKTDAFQDFLPLVRSSGN